MLQLIQTNSLLSKLGLLPLRNYLLPPLLLVAVLQMLVLLHQILHLLSHRLALCLESFDGGLEMEVKIV